MWPWLAVGGAWLMKQLLGLVACLLRESRGSYLFLVSLPYTAVLCSQARGHPYLGVGDPIMPSELRSS